MLDKAALLPGTPAALSMGVPLAKHIGTLGNQVGELGKNVDPNAFQGLLDAGKGAYKQIADKGKALAIKHNPALASGIKPDAFEGAVQGMLPKSVNDYMGTNFSGPTHSRVLRGLGGAGIGLLGGAGLGALSHFLSDKEEKKKKSLLSSMLTGGLLGGGVGGAAGAIDPIYNTVAGMLGKQAADHLIEQVKGE